MFCGQQPYLPLGTLRTALAYPSPAETLSDDVAIDTLRAVQLGHLADRLDVETDWSRTLSPGEQQRLAFGRILIARPSLAFFDETTSALDEGMEHAIYELVRERMPDCTIVSVGHRSSLENLHSNRADAARRGSMGDSDARWITADLSENPVDPIAQLGPDRVSGPLFSSDHEDRPSFGVGSGRLHSEFAEQ